MNRKLNQQDFNLIQQGLMDNAMKQHQQQKEETPKELFTGGEWEPEDKHVNESPASEWFTRVISDEHGQRVALIYGDTEMQAEANSTLIAQSKNMYYALKGFVENAMDGKRIAPNQINYYKGLFMEILKKANPSL